MIKKQITFNEELHRYTDEDKNVYTSVTTLIDKYAPKFDKEKWSSYIAEKTGLTQQQVKDNWDKITEDACKRGSVEHKLIEDSANSAIEKSKLFTTATVKLAGVEFTNVNLDVLAQSELAKKYPEIYVYLKGKILEGYKLYVEKRTYSYEHLVAGTIDCLLVKGKQFIIVDWKTNKDELKFVSGYYKKVNGIKTTQWVDKKEYLFKPINYLENCKGVKYTLQLSLYAYILELWGLQCIGLVLYHIRMIPKIDRHGKDYIETILKPYNISYDRISAELLMIDHKNGLTNSNSNKPIQNNSNLFGIN